MVAIPLSKLKPIFDIVTEKGVSKAKDVTFNKFLRSEKGRDVLKRLNFLAFSDIEANDFEGLYRYACLEYAYGRFDSESNSAILKILSDSGLQQAFHRSFEAGDNAEIERCLDQIYEANTETRELGSLPRSDADHELSQFRDTFERVIGKKRPLHGILDGQKRDAQHEEIKSTIVEQTNKQTTELLGGIEKLNKRIEFIGSASQQNVATPTEESKSSPTLSRKAQYYANLAEVENDLARNPSDAIAWTKKANLHCQHGELDKALVAINKAWEQDKVSISVINARACIITDYARDNDNISKSLISEGIALFESLRSHVGDANTDYNIGNVFGALSEYQNAIDRYRIALEHNPGYDLASQILTNIGNSLMTLGNDEAAVKAFQEAIDHYPNRWQAFLSLGDIYYKNKNYKYAAKHFKRMFMINHDLDSTTPEYCYKLARALFELNEWVDAYYWFNKVLDISPGYQDARKFKLYILKDLWKEYPRYIFDAISCFEAWKIDEPENATIASATLYLIYSSENYRDKALPIIEGSGDIDNVPPFMSYAYAMFLKDQGELRKAILWLERAFSESKEHHIVHKLADLKFDVGAYEEAISYYKLAVMDCSTPLIIVGSVTHCYHLLGNHRMSLLLSTKVVLLKSNNYVWWNNLMAALQDMGKQQIMPPLDLLEQLQSGRPIDENTIRPHIDKLLKDLESEFGAEFVQKIKSKELLPD
jgi:tetratricopeptide (TPR) repeat protein